MSLTRFPDINSSSHNQTEGTTSKTGQAVKATVPRAGPTRAPVHSVPVISGASKKGGIPRVIASTALRQGITGLAASTSVPRRLFIALLFYYIFDGRVG